MASGSDNIMPKDLQIMKNILEHAKVADYEPNVLNQMLEFTYRYVTSIVDDALLYSSYAKKKTIDCEDVKLAICLQQGKNFTTVPSREVTAELARHKNAIPLHNIRSSAGHNLPSERNSLTAPNCNLVEKKKTRTVHQVSKSHSNGTPVTLQRTVIAQKAVSSPLSINPLSQLIKASNGENKRKHEDDE